MSRINPASAAISLDASLALLVLAGFSMARTVTIELPAPSDFLQADGVTLLPIDNAYWPLPIGESFAYRAETPDGCEFSKLTVTDGLKSLVVGEQTYTALIVREQAWQAGDCNPANATLLEDTRDYHAEDSSGNVWYFGEETYALPEDGTGVCDSGGSWEAGRPPSGDPGGDAAKAGIVMLADPNPGDRYRQEYLAGEAEDRAAVLQVSGTVSIAFDDYPACLVTKEWTQLAPGEVEHKYYCPYVSGTPNPPPGGLLLVKELKARTVRVEYVGSEFAAALPGEDDSEFPSAALACTAP